MLLDMLAGTKKGPSIQKELFVFGSQLVHLNRATSGFEVIGFEGNPNAWTQTTDVACGNGKLVAITNNGAALAVANGIKHFKAVATPPSGLGSFASIAFGNGIFVLAGSSGKYATSPDGVTWSEAKSIPGLNTQLTKVAFINGEFMFGGYYINTGANVIKTPDLVKWSEPKETPALYNYITDFDYYAGRYWAVGGNRVMYSTDFINWSVLSFDSHSNIGFNGDYLYSNNGTPYTISEFKISTNTKTRNINLGVNGTSKGVAVLDDKIVTAFGSVIVAGIGTTVSYNFPNLTGVNVVEFNY